MNIFKDKFRSKGIKWLMIVLTIILIVDFLSFTYFDVVFSTKVTSSLIVITFLIGYSAGKEDSKK